MFSTVDEGKGITRYTWSGIRERTHLIEPEFARLLDDCQPSEKDGIYLVHQPWGQRLEDGVNALWMPHMEKLECWRMTRKGPEDSLLHKELRYGVGSTPFGMVFNRRFEMFVDMPSQGRISSIKLLMPGDFTSNMWALANNFDGIIPNFYPEDFMEACAGARSVHMLSSLGSETQFKKIRRRLRLEGTTPKDLYDHFDVFQQIIHQTPEGQNWRAGILYFSYNLVKAIASNPRFAKVKSYILNKYFQRNMYHIASIASDSAFSEIHHDLNLAANSHIMDTMRHLFAIAIGQAPGFSPLIDDQIMPVAPVQDVFLNDYNLHRIPTLLGPARFSHVEDSLPVYYSNRHPSAPVLTRPLTSNEAMLEMHQNLYVYTQKFLKAILSGNSRLTGTEYHKMAQSVQFDYFHNVWDYRKITQLSDMLPDNDERLLYCGSPSRHLDRTLEFDHDGPFLRGCVRISKKTPEAGG